MLYVVGRRKEALALADELPGAVVGELLRYTRITEKIFGKECDYFEIGGFVVVADDVKDMDTVKEKFINYEEHLCEWANRLKGSNFVSALYLLNNEFTILLILPISLAHESILAEIENEIEIEQEVDVNENS